MYKRRQTKGMEMESEADQGGEEQQQRNRGRPVETLGRGKIEIRREKAKRARVEDGRGRRIPGKRKKKGPKKHQILRHLFGGRS
jgi:hypothetical protein